MTEPRAPPESATAMLEIEDRGDEIYTASLESFWGAATRGDPLLGP